MLNKNILLLKLVFLLSVNILNNLVSCSEQVACNFERDWCGYSNNNNFIRWTGNNGYYVLCDARIWPSDECVLSKEIEINKTVNLSFWYRTLSGTLKVTRDDLVLWSLSGRQYKNEWIQTVIKLDAGKFKVDYFLI